MAVSLYFDHNVDRSLALALRRRGVDVLTAREDGSETENDTALLDRAAAANRVVVTHDRDFLRMAQRRQSEGTFFAGVVFIRQSTYRASQVLEGLEMVAVASEPKELWNMVIYVPM